MRTTSLSLLLLLWVLAPATAEPLRHLVFPPAANGQLVLAVDLHTHSVFSDGSVWPDIRVQEAEREQLAAVAITEHLEYQPHQQDIPHPDRKRAYAIASKVAASNKQSDLLVISGAEVTRKMPPGHINAVFLKDPNQLLVKQPQQALQAARQQGAFLFWNHPYWEGQRKDGVARLAPIHQELINKGLLHGIEVANGDDFAEEALQLALDNNLTILGTSDIHGLVSWDYAFKPGNHRTVSLVLSERLSKPAIKRALLEGRSVALFKGQFIGRPEHVAAVVNGMLAMTVEPIKNRQMVNVTFRNSGPIDLLLKQTGARFFYNASDILSVPANSSVKVAVKAIDQATNYRFEGELLNSFVGVRKHLTLNLAP